ncbi:MAG: sugar MFS transporter [Marinifilaceae bacterium]|jgi:glucose/galactose transporter|nr:sugar MFS transporter [Marinifilaceae bacterium]
MYKKIGKQESFLSMLIISSLFFIFGFVTWLNGILIPYFKISCELSDSQAMLVAFAFYIAYTVMALPSAYLLKRTKLKKGMSIGLAVMSIGSLCFLPAAYTRNYHIFLIGLFIMGAGLALLQTAANPYVTLLGPKESAAKRISIMGIFNKVAGAIAPLVLSYFVLHDGDQIIDILAKETASERALILDELILRVINPYILISLVLGLLAILIKYSKLPNIKLDSDQNTIEDENTEKKSIAEFPYLILGAIALFFYVGVEVLAGDTIINYAISLGIDMKIATNFTSYTLICMLVGYLLGIFLIPKYIKQQSMLKYSAILGISLSVLVLVGNGIFSAICLAILGLANAIIWPAIWPLAISKLGRHTNTGSAILIMAISGGAILPLIYGKLSNILGLQYAYIILIPCYLFILFYAWKGHKIKTWKK